MSKASAQEKKDHLASKTCFVMMPISDVEGYPAGHFEEVYKQLIEPAVSAAGYVCELATSTGAAHMIQLDVVTKVATADLCICDLSTNNPNVLFEYGIRQAFDKPTVLIKDDKTRRLFDLSGFRDIEYDHTLRIANTLSTRAVIQKAIIDTTLGAEDGKQVFSLVKMMQLTKAALPAEGEINAQDARFEILSRKIDSLFGLLNPQTRNRLLELTLTDIKNVKYESGRFVIEHDNRGQVAVYEDGGALPVAMFDDLRSFSSSPYMPLLDESTRRGILNLVERLSKRQGDTQKRQ